jgi:hypothetical protein
VKWFHGKRFLKKLRPNLNKLRLKEHSRYFIIFLAQNGRIRAVEVRPQKFWANFFRFGRISSILQPKNLLFWGNFAQIERISPEILGAKLNCADSPISGEKNNYCEQDCKYLSFKLQYVSEHPGI